jgi:hypothetical protein
VIGIIFVLTVLFSPNGILGYLDSLYKQDKIPILRRFNNHNVLQKEESS